MRENYYIKNDGALNSLESGIIKFDNEIINDIPAYKRNIGMVFKIMLYFRI